MILPGALAVAVRSALLIGVAVAGAPVPVNEPAPTVTARPDEPVEWRPPVAQLERGWKPTGHGEAKERRVGTETELHLNVGGVEISAPEKVECPQGFRWGIPLYVQNRGQPSKVVQWSALCPPDILAQRRLMLVSGQEGGRNAPALQCLLPGQQACQLVFSTEGQERRLPVLLDVKRAFPLLGVTVPATDDGAALLSRWGRLPAQIVHVDAGAGDVATAFRMAQAQQAVVALGPIAVLSPDSGEPPDLSALERIVTEHHAHVDLWEPLGLPEAWRTGASALPADLKAFVTGALAGMAEAREIVHRQDADGLVASPRWPASVHQPGSPAYQLLEALLAAGMARQVDCLAVEAPPLGPAPAELSAPAKPRAELKGATPSAAWVEFDRRCGTTAVRALLIKHNAALPILVCGERLQPSGSDAADALGLLRSLALSLATGLTAVTFDTGAKVGQPPSPNMSPEQGSVPILPQATAETDPFVFQALAAFLPELCGLAPALDPAGNQSAASELGRALTYRTFLRGQEGVLLLWNNTDRSPKVGVRVRGLALELHRASLRPLDRKLMWQYRQGPSIPRRKQAEPAQQPDEGFKDYIADLTSKEASRLRDRVRTKADKAEEDIVRLELAPYEFTAVALRFAGAHAGWLAEVKAE
jgi:hypothetical protein